MVMKRTQIWPLTSSVTTIIQHSPPSLTIGNGKPLILALFSLPVLEVGVVSLVQCKLRTSEVAII